MYSPGGSTRQLNQQEPGGYPGVLQEGVGVDDFFDADEFLRSIPVRLEDPPLLPVQIGQSRTSKNIIALNELAQKRGITAAFDYEELAPQRFSVKLTLGGRRHVEDAGPWPSKKAAKEAVCEKGIQVLKDMESAMPTPSDDQNWVGMLQQFYDVSGTCQRPVYTDFAVGQHFACELEIDMRYSVPFGGRLVIFPNKKAAKANAAREAIEWLIANKYIGPEGLPAKKKQKSGGSVATVTESGSTIAIKQDASFAQRVNAICPLMGFSAPEYRLTPHIDSMYSGAAYFNHPMLTREPIGEVRNLFGKKNAKEEIAKAVLAYLKEWANNKGVELKEE